MSKRRKQFGYRLAMMGVCLFSILPVAVAQNVNWGPFRLNLGFTTGFEYTDNVNASETNPKPDVKLRIGPTVTGGIFLPFAGGEQFTLAMSATYEKSLTGNAQDSFGAPLAATLTLPLRVSQWDVLLSDAFSFTNDPLESTFAVNRNRVPQYSNTALISATRQMGRLAVTFAGQRLDKITPDDPQQEEIDYQFSLTPAFFFRDNYSLFWRNSVGIVQPQDPTRQPVAGWSTEIGVNGQITPYLSGTLSIGFAHAHLDQINLGPGSGIFGGIFDPKLVTADNVDGISSTLALSYAHPLRPNTTYVLSFFRSPGVTAMLDNSNIQAIEGVSFGIAHRLSRYITLAPTVTYTHIEDAGKGGAGEVADLLAITMGVSRSFTKHLSGTATYQYQKRSSNLTGQSYDVNVVTGDLTYFF